MEQEKKSAVKAVSFMMIITLLGKLLGLVREQFLALNYSVGIEASAFLTASRIPRIFFDVVFASAISASFIPIFNEYMKQKGKDEAFKLSNNFITLVGFVTLIITFLGIAFAPQLTHLFADGFDEATAALCTKLLRILFPSTFFTGLAFSFVGILQSMDEFNVPAAMSIASNLVIIFYYIFLNERFGIYGLTFAFLAGWMTQALIQLPALLKKGYRFKVYINLKDEGIKKIMLLMMPVMISTWIQPINLAINTKFASRLFEGAGVSVIEYANTVYSIIVGVFALSIANVIFPRLSRMSIEKNSHSFGKTVGETLKIMTFLLIPMTVGLMCISRPLISLIYQRGDFSNFAADITSKALFFFAPGMIGFGMQSVLSRAFYAEKNGRTPLISGILSIVVNVLLCMLLSPILDVGGLALASSVSQTLAAIMLTVPMQKKHKIFEKHFAVETFKMIICAAIMAAVAIFIRNAAIAVIPPSFKANFVAVFGAALGGCLVYIASAYILKIDVAIQAVGISKKLLRKGRNDI